MPGEGEQFHPPAPPKCSCLQFHYTGCSLFPYAFPLTVPSAQKVLPPSSLSGLICIISSVATSKSPAIPKSGQMPPFCVSTTPVNAATITSCIPVSDALVSMLPGQRGGWGGAGARIRNHLSRYWAHPRAWHETCYFQWKLNQRILAPSEMLFVLCDTAPHSQTKENFFPLNTKQSTSFQSSLDCDGCLQCISN